MKIRRNIYIMYAISLLYGMVFYAPIASLYRQARGLSLGQIALIESISFLISLAMELPWGVLADRIGYKRTMFASCALIFLSKLIFWRAYSFGAFLAERFVLSAGIAGMSGVDESILYLSCEEDDSQRVFGIEGALGTAGMLGASLLYSAFIREDYALAAVLTVLTHGAAMLLPLGLQEVRPPERERQAPVREFLTLLRGTLRDRRFLLLLLALALYGETVRMMTTWLNQNQYQLCGMGLGAIGLAYTAVTAASMAGAFSKTVTDRVGRRRFPLLVVGLAAAACLALAFTRSAALSFVCILALTVGSELLFPLTSQVYNDHVTTRDRATQMSIFAVIDEAVSAGAELAYGQAADVSLRTAFLLGAAVCALCAAVIAACCRQYFVKS